jgi:hypothetical protein
LPIALSLSRGERKWHNPVRKSGTAKFIAEQSQQSRLELGLRLSRPFPRRNIWIVDAHRDDGRRFVVRADEKLTVFLGTRINDSSEQSNCLDQLPRFFQKKASLNGS